MHYSRVASAIGFGLSVEHQPCLVTGSPHSPPKRPARVPVQATQVSTIPVAQNSSWPRMPGVTPAAGETTAEFWISRTLDFWQSEAPPGTRRPWGPLTSGPRVARYRQWESVQGYREDRPPPLRERGWRVIPEDAAFTKLKHTKRSSERLIQNFQSVLDSALSLSDSKLISNVGGNSDQANHCNTGHDFLL